MEGGAEALFTKPIDFVMLGSEIDTRVNALHDYVGYWGKKVEVLAHPNLDRLGGGLCPFYLHGSGTRPGSMG